MAKLIDNKLVFGKLPKRPEDSNKGTFGKILNIAGSKSFIGAAFLSSISALKIGAGYVSLACPSEIVPIIAPMAPELTYLHLKSDSNGIISDDNFIDNLYTYNVISMGCGIAISEDIKKFIFYILNNLNKTQKVVIDADGINILSNHKGEISLKNTVITPHPRELSRLLNVSIEEILDNREKYARITVLKGHKSIVTNGEKIFINQSGSSALAKAGTGDVLTGIIAGLLAQKLSPLDAAIIGTYIHGLAGDIAAADLTKYSVLATDIIDYLPFAIKLVISEE